LDFQLTSEQQRLRNKCRELAADFATRAAAHDRDASHPVENYERLREEGFLALTVGKEWGGSGASFLDHTLAYEVLAQGCPSTALAFNMHASVVMPLLESVEVSAETKQRVAELVVRERKLIAGNFSEPVTTSLIGERPLKSTGPPRPRRISHHRSQDVRLDARSGRFCFGDGIPGGCDEPLGRYHPAAAL